MKKLPCGWRVRLSISEALERISKAPSPWAHRLPIELSKAHMTRQNEWLASRLALCDAFQLAGVDISTTAFQELRFLDYKTLLGLEEWTFSISHTADAALVWLASRNDGFSIGVDIENKSRKITDLLKTRVVRSDDLPLDTLSLWSAKEAAYKALDPALQEKTVLSLISIRTDQFQLANQQQSGFWIQDHSQDWIESYAWI